MAWEALELTAVAWMNVGVFHVFHTIAVRAVLVGGSSAGTIAQLLLRATPPNRPPIVEQLRRGTVLNYTLPTNQCCIKTQHLAKGPAISRLNDR